MDPELRRATLDELIDLRHVVLRHGMPRDAAIFPGDDAPVTRHYGAFDGSRIVGCVTLHASTWDDAPAWQLRGMAVAPDRARAGVGRALLQFLESDLAAADAWPFLWCNARVPAAGFYKKQGWVVRSAVFEIATAGPHVKMTRQLS